MTLAERIYQTSLDLPEYAAREALDFIEFLAERHAHGEAAVVNASPSDETLRQEALEHLAGVRIDWGGKPIPDRNALYDNARG
ncbi:hypothetical protein [uncultured Thiodictyon sp.]|uniref:hypothetical protein n=1 Tax=uncultured Thiodictyon sp. TaxID=1846217 RepID=UPI0025CED99E|nr:hypothetical protein [uncultured Thiodictyon sp.]